MESLPAEILDLIIQQLRYAKSFQDLRSFALVSSHLNSASSKLLFHHVELDFARALHLKDLLGARDQKGIAICRAMRELTIIRKVGCDRHICSTLPRLEVYQALLRCSPKIERFIWKHPDSIEKGLLDLLHKHDDVRELDLTYSITQGTRLSNKLRLASLSHHSKISILRLELKNSNPQCIDFVFWIPPLHIPNLKELEIRCLGGARLRFTEDGMLPPLETLSLSGYGTSLYDPDDEILSRLQLPKLQHLILSDLDMDYLNEILQSLLQLASVAQPSTMSLITFKLSQYPGIGDPSEWYDMLPEFLCSISGLETLELVGVCIEPYSFHEAIAQQSQTLQVLKITGYESYDCYGMPYDPPTVFHSLEEWNNSVKSRDFEVYKLEDRARELQYPLFEPLIDALRWDSEELDRCISNYEAARSLDAFIDDLQVSRLAEAVSDHEAGILLVEEDLVKEHHELDKLANDCQEWRFLTEDEEKMVMD